LKKDFKFFADLIHLKYIQKEIEEILIYGSVMRKILLLFTLSSYCLLSQGQGTRSAQYSMETLINHYINAYPFTTNNQFRLSAYAELKGDFSVASQSLILDFGVWGKMSFYVDNCLLRTSQGTVFYLNKGDKSSNAVNHINEALDNIFENITLLGNHNADLQHIDFVNTWLARKNIEPFEKVYTRHILIKYGRYEPENRQVVFHTDWLPNQEYQYKRPGDNTLIKRHNSPLKLLLDTVNLRGYYVSVGGFVYVEDVKRKVKYATGEQYMYNVSAFKLFIQKLFVQTTQYVTETSYKDKKVVKQTYENAKRKIIGDDKINSMAQESSSGRSARLMTVKQKDSGGGLQMLYGKYTWIPTMLARLRAHNIEISDPDILHFLVDQPYFPRIYQYLSKEEKYKVDKFISRHKPTRNRRA